MSYREAHMDGAVVDLGTWTYGAPSLPIVHEVAPPPTLQQIKMLQDALTGLPQIECPVEHMFAPGMYVRTCTIPADSIVVGKMHRHQHPVFLMRGTVRINTDKGMETITGPHKWVSQENAKRALRTLTECEFVTVHLNADDTQELEALEADIIVPEALIPYEEKQALGQFTDELQGVYA